MAILNSKYVIFEMDENLFNSRNFENLMPYSNNDPLDGLQIYHFGPIIQYAPFFVVNINHEHHEHYEAFKHCIGLTFVWDEEHILYKTVYLREGRRSVICISFEDQDFDD